MHVPREGTFTWHALIKDLLQRRMWVALTVLMTQAIHLESCNTSPNRRSMTGAMCRRSVRHAHLKQLLDLGDGQLHSIRHGGPLCFVVCVHLMPARHARSCPSLALLV